MKVKILVYLLLAAITLFGIQNGTAHAIAEEEMQKVVELQKQINTIDNVEDNVVVTTDGYVFVAVKPVGIISRSTCNKMKENIGLAVKTAYPNEKVIVTTAVKAYASLKSCTDRSTLTAEDLLKYFIPCPIPPCPPMNNP